MSNTKTWKLVSPGVHCSRVGSFYVFHNLWHVQERTQLAPFFASLGPHESALLAPYARILLATWLGSVFEQRVRQAIYAPIQDCIDLLIVNLCAVVNIAPLQSSSSGPIAQDADEFERDVAALVKGASMYDMSMQSHAANNRQLLCEWFSVPNVWAALTHVAAQPLGMTNSPRFHALVCAARALILLAKPQITAAAAAKTLLTALSKRLDSCFLPSHLK